jgi:hypothetical protein
VLKILSERDKKLASLYMKNWEEHAQHSEDYAAREDKGIL